MRHTYETQNTCSSKITFDLNGDIVTNVKFTDGCNGNLKAIGTLVDGMTVDQIEQNFKGITCGRRPTSCADQLSRAVREAYDKEV